MKPIKIFLTFILIFLVFNLVSSHLFDYDAIEVFSSKVNKPSFYIIVDLDVNLLYLYKEGVLTKEYPISSGKGSTPSPLGTWKIVSEATWGEGFGGTWMGFNVPCPT